MSNHNEVYNRFFEEKEREDYEKRVESEEGFKEKVENARWEQIDNELDKLEYRVDKVNQDFEERFKAYKEAVLKAEKKSEATTAEKIKDKIKESVSEKKDKIMSELKKQAEKRIPFVGGALFDFADNLLKPSEEEKGFMGKFFGGIGKTIGVFILGLLGVKAGYEGLKNIRDEENTGTSTEEQDNETEKPTELDEAGLKKDMYVGTGYGIISYLNPIELKEQTEIKNVFKRDFEGKSYRELFDLYIDCNEAKRVENGVTNITPEERFKVLHSLFHDYSITLYETRLSQKNIKDILETEGIEEILSESEIDEIRSKGYDFTKLDFDKISKLLTLSFKGILGASMIAAKNEIEGAYNYIFAGNEGLIGDIKSEIAEREKNLIPKNVLNIIKGGDSTSIRQFGGSDRVGISREELLKGKEAGKDYEDGELEKLDKFLEFRNEILEIPQNTKYSLGIGEEFNTSFKEGLNLGKIYLLYLMLDGKSINDVDSFEKGNLYFWIMEVLKKKNGENEVYGRYEQRIFKELTSDKAEVFSKNDKKIMTLLAYKLLNASENELKGKFTRGKGFIDEYFKGLLPDSLEDKEKESIVDGVEYAVLGLLASYLVLGKTRVEIKIAIAASGLLGYIALFLACKGTLEKLKANMNKDDYERISKELGMDPLEYTTGIVSEMLSEYPPTISIKSKEGGTKSVKVDNMKVVEDLNNGMSPEDINEWKVKGDYLYIDENGEFQDIDINESIEKSYEAPIFVNTKGNGLYIVYNEKKYTFDVGPNSIIGGIDNFFGSKKDGFEGWEFQYDNLDLDLQAGKIIFKGSGYSLNIKEINDIILRSIRKVDPAGDSYYIIKKGDPKYWGTVDANLILTTKSK